MSLEQALAANTAALQALTAALASVPHPAPSMQPAPTTAPFTAAVVPPPTAPVEQTVTSPAPTTAFAQSAATTPPPAAPVVPPTASPAASGERDSKGMPWDGRIHASSKAKVADGSWRYKRGIDDAVIAPIEAEIRAALGAPAVAAAPVGSAFAPHPFYEQPVAVVAPPAAPPVPSAAPAPVVAPPPVAPVAVPVAPPAAVVGMTYEMLMAALPPKIVSGELTAAQMQEACEQYGVPSVASLAQRPDLVPLVAAALKL